MKEIGWLVYSTKHTNCQELGAAITMAIQMPVVLQFKQIVMGHPKGTKAHMVHIMVGATQATNATLKLEGIYGKASLNNKSTQYPLGQCLLLGPLAATLNATNLGQLNLLLKRQALFCCKLVMLFTQDIAYLDGAFDITINNQRNAWSLRRILMQVTHPKQENCAFFHSINSNWNGRGTIFSLLPSAAPHSRSIVCNLLPFLKWMLSLIAPSHQINKMIKQFKLETVTNQNHLQWDPENNCIHQAANNMIGKVLQDYMVYNLTTQASRPPSVVTTAPPKQTQATRIGTNQINLANQQDMDSLSNSNLSQGTWFMMTTTQIDTLANRQEKLEKQMQERFKTILTYRNPQRYATLQ